MSAIRKKLESTNVAVLVVYTMIAAFASYASMYAFRKPFTATSYEGLTAFTLFGVTFGYKPIAVIAQLLGYMGSKFIGIKVASEASMSKRVPLVLMLILFAELMLIGFALTPAPYNILFLFLNGLPLGMVWSLLFGIIEGRKISEFLGLAMSVSVIFSSGVVKSVGRWLMTDFNVPEFWMPAATGACFIPLLLIALYMMYQVPPPTEEDVAVRSKRHSMSLDDRKSFLKQYFWGVVFLVIGYLALMVYRDIRDTFMIDIMKEMGHTVEPSMFVTIESWVGVGVIVILCSFWKVNKNSTAVKLSLGLIALGAILLGSSTVMLEKGMLSPVAFYILNGFGLYVSFVLYQSILMDRLLGSIKTLATASFLIAIADSYGYFSTVALYLAKDIFSKIYGVEIQWIEILTYASYFVAIIVPLMTILVLIYFKSRMIPRKEFQQEATKT